MSVQLQADEFVAAARTHVQTVLAHAADTQGPQPTGMLANCLDRRTLQRARFAAEDGQDVVLCDLAGQQSLMRVMAGLSQLTGEPSYVEAALSMLRFALRELRPYGLLLWGNHAAVDLLTRRPLYLAAKGRMHELKNHYPCYELMWQANPDATRWFIEAFWQAHVTDWSRLEFNRHGRIDMDMYSRVGDPWGRPYVGGDLFFPSRNLGFLNTGSDLYYAAAMLHHLDGRPSARLGVAGPSNHSGPLTWARRLVDRFAGTRDTKTGMSGYIYTRLHAKWDHSLCIDRALVQFAEQFAGHVCTEGTLAGAGAIHMVCGYAALARLHVAELLGAAGEDFLREAVADLLAYSTWAYEFADNTFHPCLTDGYRLTGQAIAKAGYFGPAGQVFREFKGDALLLWAYVKAWRLSRHDRLWAVARNIAKDCGIGDIGAAPGDKPTLPPNAEFAEPMAVFALLELNKAFPGGAFLPAAAEIGRSILRRTFDGQLFVPTPAVRDGLVHIDAVEPLALLHIAAASMGTSDEMLGYCGGAGGRAGPTGWALA